MMLPGLYVVLGALSVSVTDEPSWQRYAPPDSRFEVSMPAKPTITVRYVERGNVVLPVHMASVNRFAQDGFPFNGPSDDFLVSWTDYSKASKRPSSSSKTFDTMRDALAEAKGAVVTCDHEVTLGGYPGRSIMLRMDDGQVADVVFYVTRSRVYQIMAQTRTGDSYAADRTRFLQSFKLTRDAE